MNDTGNSRFGGIYAAAVCPMMRDGSIDEAALESHIETVTAVPGICGILCNGHAGENFTLTREEKRRVTEITRSVAGPAALVVSGINHEASEVAVSESRDAREAGADALLVFPPYSWALSIDPRTVVAHHLAVRSAVDIPLMLYQAPVGAGTLAYPAALLSELVKLPGIVAIKEGSWESAAYEANRRLVKALAPDVAVMASGDEHLLSCFVLGSDGSMVSLAALIPETIVALAGAVQRSDLDAARACHDVIYPLARAIYGAAPAGYATARLKTALMLAGHIPRDTMRAPIRPLDTTEIEALRVALNEANVQLKT